MGFTMRLLSLHPLSYDWVPPVLLERQKELNEMLGKTLETDFPRNLWIQGKKGQGKTLTAKIFMNEVQIRNAGSCFYISCQSSLKQTLKIFCDMNQLDVPQYYLNTTTVIRELNKKDKLSDRVFFVIDDIDKFRHRRLADPLAYQIYETLLSLHKKFSIIFITRSLFTMRSHYFEEDTQSRLQLLPILFKVYSANQLKKIIKQRLDLAVGKDNYTEGAVNLLAALTARIGADVRKTLEILSNAISVAKNRLDEDAVRQAWLMEKRRFWKEQLMQLPPHQLLILTIIAKLQKSYDIINTNMILREYHHKCKTYNVDPLSKRMVYYTIDNLERQGYIDRERGLRLENFIRLNEKPDNILNASAEINWNELLL